MGAKTSIAESVESLFCFTKIQNQMFWFVCFFIPKELKGFVSLQRMKEMLFVFCVHGTCFLSFDRTRNNEI